MSESQSIAHTRDPAPSKSAVSAGRNIHKTSTRLPSRTPRPLGVKIAIIPMAVVTIHASIQKRNICILISVWILVAKSAKLAPFPICVREYPPRYFPISPSVRKIFFASKSGFFARSASSMLFRKMVGCTITSIHKVAIQVAQTSVLPSFQFAQKISIRNGIPTRNEEITWKKNS